jgi:hypothetical protein
MSNTYQLEESGNAFLEAIGPIWVKQDSVYNIKIKIADNHVRPKIPVAHGGILAALCDYAMAKSLVLNIDTELSGKKLTNKNEINLKLRDKIFQNKIESKEYTIIQTTRIGITQGFDLPWRWFLNESRSVSKR